MSSIWKDLHLNPRVESCFTCLRRVSSFLCTFKVFGYQPPNDVASLLFSYLWTVILNWRSSMTEFVSWRLCLIVFKTFSDRSGIRTHAHTRVPEFSTEEFLESAALDRSTVPPGLRRHISFRSGHLNWVTVSIQRCNLLNGLCQLFGKICI